MPTGLSTELKSQMEKGLLSPAEVLRVVRRPATLATRAAGAPGPEPEASAALAELDSLVGLAKVKRVVREVQALVKVHHHRRLAGLFTSQNALHMIFTGHPGTGKTTVARIMGGLLHSMGILARGHLVEVERADLVGEYIGHTAQRTRETVRRAVGGVLFIDEAYALARGGERDFGREAIDVLVKAMEDHRDELVLILAGYPVEMEWFLQQNPGLRSRFPFHIEFPDYTPVELVQIAELMWRRQDYRLHPEATAVLRRAVRATPELFCSEAGNARAIRNLVERTARCQALRLLGQPAPSRDELMNLTPEDMVAALRDLADGDLVCRQG